MRMPSSSNVNKVSSQGQTIEGTKNTNAVNNLFQKLTFSMFHSVKHLCLQHVHKETYLFRAQGHTLPVTYCGVATDIYI
jgi:hypothetical protein